MYIQEELLLDLMYIDLSECLSFIEILQYVTATWFSVGRMCNVIVL